jgi:hypothetical protein
MCKLRRRGQEYGGQGSRGIDPSLQPLPFATIAGAVLMEGQHRARDRGGNMKAGDEKAKRKFNVVSRNDVK